MILIIKYALITKNICVVILTVLFLNLAVCSFVNAKQEVVDEKTVLSPRSNFYRWVNNDWLMTTPIPTDLPGVNNFLIIQKKVNDELIDTFSLIRKKPSATVEERKVVLLYEAYTNLVNRNELGIKPIISDLALIDNAKSHDEIALLFAHMQKVGVQTPFSYHVGPDFKNSERNVVFISQTGLGSDRSNYVNVDSRARINLQLYQDYLQRLFKLANFRNAKRQAESVVFLEQAMAKIQWSEIDNRDTQKIYNIVDYASLKRLANNLNIDGQLSELSLPAEHSFNVMQPSYIKAFNQFFITQDIEVWKSYLKAQLLLTYGRLLDDRFQRSAAAYDIKLGLYDKEPNINERAIAYLNSNVGMLFGRIYVESFFDEKEKVKLYEIIHHIQDEYRSAIKASTRMSDKTKASALDKLDKMTVKIAYPDEWLDYSTLHLMPNQLVSNHKKIALYEVNRNIAKLGKPMDTNDWGHPPQEVNAYYDLNANTFVLLAGILHAPFYDKNASDAEQYGGIGFVIGHEIGHAFDDQGSEFDGDGNFMNWWKAEDKVEFDKIKNTLIAQANNYEMWPGVHLNGELEIGEILGDKSGAEIAFKAYQKIMIAKNLDQDKSYQDFFKQLAVTWRDHLRKSYQLKILDSDPHPPSEFRANGIVKNFDEFHEVYKTKPGDRMYLPKEERVKLW